MKLNEIGEEIKRRAIITEFLTPAKNGTYVCLECESGTGKKGTGMVIVPETNETRLKCFACDRSFTNIDVIAHHLGLGTTGEDFKEVVKYGSQYFGIETGEEFEKEFDSKESVKSKSGEKNLEIKKVSEEFIEDARQNLKDFFESIEGGKWRGLTLETLKRLNWGYLKEFAHPKTPKKIYPAVIIPNDSGGIFARGTETKEYANVSPTGTTTIYLPEGTDFDLIVTEGAINGASILQAVHAPKFGIMASGGTSGNTNVVARLQELYPAEKPRVLIAYDNDSNQAGQKAAVKLRESLVEASFRACTINITKTPDVDVNDVLNANNGEKKLAQMIQLVLVESQEEFLKQEKEILGEVSAEYYTEKFLEYLEKRQGFSDRKTGFANMDAEMGAFLPGVYIVGGLAALGKTTFCWQLLEQVARQGENCIYCSYEMSAGELYSKRAARAVYLFENSSEIEKALTATQIGRSKFYNHKENFEKVLNSLREEKISLRVWELTDTDIENLFERLKMFCKLKNKPPVVVIDYLQILAGNVENVKTAIDDILRRLKNFQRETNTTFIVISSLNRANYSTEISFESFKESGGIEYSADVVWGLQLYFEDGKRNFESIEKAKKEIPRQIQLKCLKNRYGKNFDVSFFYYPNVDYFKEMEEYGDYTDYRQNESGEMVELKQSGQKKSKIL